VKETGPTQSTENYPDTGRLDLVIYQLPTGFYPNHQALEVSHAFTRTKNINELHNQTSGLLYFADTELLNISSSEIRGILFNAASSGKIGAQQSLSGLLPDPIIHYLQHL